MNDFTNYLNDKKFKDYKFGDKIIRANFTAKTLLKIASFSQEKNLNSHDLNLKMLNAIFKEDDVKFILDNLTGEGLVKLVEDILKILSPQKSSSPR